MSYQRYTKLSSDLVDVPQLPKRSTSPGLLQSRRLIEKMKVAENDRGLVRHSLRHALGGMAPKSSLVERKSSVVGTKEFSKSTEHEWFPWIRRIMVVERRIIASHWHWNNQSSSSICTGLLNQQQGQRNQNLVWSQCNSYLSSSGLRCSMRKYLSSLSSNLMIIGWMDSFHSVIVGSDNHYDDPGEPKVQISLNIALGILSWNH